MKVIYLDTYRQERQRIMEQIEQDLAELDCMTFAAQIQTAMVWLEVARQCLFQPLYSIRGGKHS